MFAKERMGFMPALCVAFLEELTDKEKLNFEELERQEERAEMVLKHPFIAEKFARLEVAEGKDVRKSVAAREEGNQRFQEGSYQAALNKYSVAVAFADQGKPDYSLALANRSACLQRLGKCDLSLEDIDTAMSAGYPKDKLYKVVERKAQCLAEQGKVEKAHADFERALTLVETASLNPKAKDKFKAGVEVQLQKLKKRKDAKENTTEASDQEQERKEKRNASVTQVGQAHPQYPGLDHRLEVAHTDGQGRFVLAHQFIPAGTVLMAEEPLGWALEVERMGTHCQHCLGQVLVIVPCPSCTSVAFCSRTCMQAGLDLYHRRECGLMRLLAASALNNFALMAVRALARHTAEELVAMRCKLEAEPNTCWGTTSEAAEVYRGDDLRTGLNLVHHSEDLDTDEKILRTLVSLFLMTCLKRTPFYSQEKGLSKSDELYIAGLIYTLLNAAPANTHEVHQLATPCLDRWSSMAKCEGLGSGLYPTAALFNHSCHPNIMRVNVGRRMVSVACRDILPGQEVTDCYGLPWYSVPKEKRNQIQTRFYKFECKCVACEGDWPLSDMLGLSLAQGQVTREEVEEVNKMVAKAMDVLNNQQQWEAGLTILRAAQEKMAKVLPSPSLELFHSTIAVWRALWLMVGNKKLTKVF